MTARTRIERAATSNDHSWVAVAIRDPDLLVICENASYISSMEESYHISGYRIQTEKAEREDICMTAGSDLLQKIESRLREKDYGEHAISGIVNASRVYLGINETPLHHYLTSLTYRNDITEKAARQIVEMFNKEGRYKPMRKTRNVRTKHNIEQGFKQVMG